MEKAKTFIGISPIQAQGIASVLSGKLKVKIHEGRKWAYDFMTQAIEYRQEDLIYLSEIDVIANFLHEAGHANYSIAPHDLNWQGIEPNHKDKIKEHLLNLIEDFRIEDKLRASYPYAKSYLPLYSFKTAYFIYKLRAEYVNNGEKIPPYLLYCWAIYSGLAGKSYYFEDNEQGKDLINRVKKTLAFCKKARLSQSTHEVLDIIKEKVYPIIKDLLLDDKSPSFINLTYNPQDKEKPYFPDLLPAVRHLINPLANILNRLLTSVKFDKYVGSYRSGRLNEKKLYRFATGSDRLFQKKLEAKSKDYVFALVIDNSGSMGSWGQTREDTRIENALKGAILFSYVLEKIHIPFEIWGFNSLIKQYKRADQDLASIYKTAFKTMFDETHCNNANYNNDGEAINLVSKSLLTHKGKKVMFVISDGRPAPTAKSSFFEIKHEIRQAIKKKINLVGFGIGSDNACVKDYYPTPIVVDKVDELPQIIGKTLKSYLSKND